MKNSLIYISGAISFAIAVGYIVYKHVTKKGKGHDVLNDDKTTDAFLIKRIETLSYEFLIEEAKSLLHNINLPQTQVELDLCMAVTPNKLSQLFFQTPKTIEILETLEIKENEKNRMIILSIKTAEKILVSEIIIAGLITDDFFDFVPDDKVYIKKISIAKQ